MSSVVFNSKYSQDLLQLVLTSEQDVTFSLFQGGRNLYEPGNALGFKRDDVSTICWAESVNMIMLHFRYKADKIFNNGAVFLVMMDEHGARCFLDLMVSTRLDQARLDSIRFNCVTSLWLGEDIIRQMVENNSIRAARQEGLLQKKFALQRDITTGIDYSTTHLIATKNTKTDLTMSQLYFTTGSQHMMPVNRILKRPTYTELSTDKLSMDVQNQQTSEKLGKELTIIENLLNASRDMDGTSVSVRNLDRMIALFTSGLNNMVSDTKFQGMDELLFLLSRLVKIRKGLQTSGIDVRDLDTLIDNTVNEMCNACKIKPWKSDIKNMYDWSIPLASWTQDSDGNKIHFIDSGPEAVQS
ncbi:MAG: hypothetical protein Q9192_007067, partial [Flavoplaca navasiana]